MKHATRLVCGVATASWLAYGTAAADAASPEKWREIRQEDVQRINAGLQAGQPTVDVGVYVPANLDPLFLRGFSLDEFLAEFGNARRIFEEAGVQLRLAWVKTGNVRPEHLEIQSNEMRGATPSSRRVNMYHDTLRQRAALSDEAHAAFESIVERHRDAHRTVHVVILQDVFMSFFDRIDARTWQVRTISTGGLSFPGYSYRNLPLHLRGVITVTRNDKGQRLLAHELGHKLINASHEYRATDPQHEIRAEGGLMLYGQGTEIPEGAEGRWHRERLHRSPFVYRLDSKGARQWNPDYVEGGHYYDPVYGEYVVQFEPGEPPVAQP